MKAIMLATNDIFRHLYLFSFMFVLISVVAAKSEKQADAYGNGFFNHSGCLYSYLEGGELTLNTADGDTIYEELNVDEVTYDSAKSKCTGEVTPGRLVFSFKFEGKNKLKSMALSMKISPSPSEGYWEINQANLTITRADIDKRRTFGLRVSEFYASLRHSYSCSSLTLKTILKRKSDFNETGKYEPHASVTLTRFQLQPFQELDKTIFAPSYDCSSWFTVVGIMGLGLILFMTIVALIGVKCLLSIESNDYKHCREGLKFTQSQMEANKQK